MSTDYRLERLTKETVKDVWWLMKAIGNTMHELSYYQKKFDTTFTDVSYVGYLAYHRQTGEAAAFYGVFPCYVVHNGVKVLAAQSGDTITGPAHQKKGLFTLLAQETYKLAATLGIQFVFGFPNENSKHGFYNKLNWKRNEDLLVYSITVKTLPIFRIMRKLQLLNSVYKIYHAVVRLFIRPTLEYPQNSLANYSQGYVFRDINFYHYKSYSESYFVTIKGITVWYKIDNGLQVGDIWMNEGQNAEDLTNALYTLSLCLGINNVVFIVSRNSRYDKMLSERYDSYFKMTAGAIHLLNPGEPIHLTHVWADTDTF